MKFRISTLMFPVLLAAICFPFIINAQTSPTVAITSDRQAQIQQVLNLISIGLNNLLATDPAAFDKLINVYLQTNTPSSSQPLTTQITNVTSGTGGTTSTTSSPLITLSTSTLLILPGGGGGVNIFPAAAGTINLSYSSLPSGVTAVYQTLFKSTVSTGSYSKFAFAVNSNVPPGTYRFNIIATSGSVTQQYPVTFTVPTCSGTPTGGINVEFCYITTVSGSSVPVGYWINYPSMTKASSDYVFIYLTDRNTADWKNGTNVYLFSLNNLDVNSSGFAVGFANLNSAYPAGKYYILAQYYSGTPFYLVSQDFSDTTFTLPAISLDQAAQMVSTSLPSSPTTTTNPPSGFTHIWNSDLYFGLRDDPDVRALQTALTLEDTYKGQMTGNFFDFTLAGVKAFQQKYNIPATGYVGTLTRTQLNALYSK